MTRTLKMVFDIRGGGTCTFNLEDHKNDLTRNQVVNVMNLIVDEEAIDYNGGDATDINDLYIYETNKVALT